MNKNFHYGVIRVLCEKAGLTSKDSQVIAYASQYVDNCVKQDYISIRVEGFPYSPEWQELFNRDSCEFWPVQTSHKDADIIRSFNPKVSRKIWSAFHMVPTEIITQENISDKDVFITKENGPVAQALVNNAVDSIAKSRNMNHGIVGNKELIKLGIALHSFADSWAHDDFSGIKDHRNQKKETQIRAKGQWKNVVNPGTFEIGHAFGSAPDDPVVWRYQNVNNGDYIEKDNVSRFLECAEIIYQLLCRITEHEDPFSDIEKRIKRGIESGETSYFFPEIKFYYDKNEWKDKAIKFNQSKTKAGRNKWVYDFGGDMKWFYFQLEALNQRKYIGV